MRQFHTIDDFRKRYVADNKIANQFVTDNNQISVLSLKAFKDKYYSKKPSLGSSFSERVFSYWLYKEVEQFTPLVIRTQEILLITLPLGTEVQVKKSVDLSLEYNNGKTFIEFKTNIDMIEKDLYKFYLHHRFSKDEQSKKLLFVWESTDSRFYKSGSDSQYFSLLNLALQDRVIDEFIYLPIDPDDPLNEDFLVKELGKLKNFLTI